MCVVVFLFTSSSPDKAIVVSDIIACDDEDIQGTVSIAY